MTLALWLAACRSRPAPEPSTTPTGGPDAHTAAPTGSTGTPDPHTGGAPEVALLGDALACDPTPPPERPGADLRRVTLSTAATCNDGTAPVLFVAAATDPDHARDWVLYLEPGLYCGDAAACTARWCGTDPTYDASKMSSRWAPEAQGATGVLDPRPDNVFGTWNRVFFAYCSSDLWTGSRRDVVLDDGTPFRLHFDGAAILDAGLDALAAGVVSDDGLARLPTLATPGEVLFVGSSSAAFGVLQHEDRVAARLGAERFTPVLDGWTTHPAPGVVDATTRAIVDDVTRRMWTDAHDAVWGTVLDDSCAAAEPEPWRCTDPVRLRTSHLDHPGVVRGDLLDATIYPFWQAYGLAFADAADLVGQTLRAEATLGESVTGPACGVHWVTGTAGFFDVTARDAVDGGLRLSLHDAVAGHLLGARVEAVDTPAGDGSRCR